MTKAASAVNPEWSSDQVPAISSQPALSRLRPHEAPFQPARVALVSDWSFPRRGGIETHILALAQKMRGHGVAADIVTSFPGPAQAEGVAIRRVDCLRMPFADIAVSPFLVSRIREQLASGSYDLVHVHSSIVAPFCLAALPAARSLGLPVVVTFHSVMRTLPRFLALFDSLNGWSEGVTLSGVSSLVANQLADALRNRTVHVVSNGFDRSLWHRTGLPAAGGASRIVSAMRLQARKRPMALLDAFAEAIRLMPAGGPELFLTIAGEGPQRGALEERIRQLGLGHRITLSGWLTRDELSALYRASSLFVMPSTREAFCIAALEARANGLPVLARAGTGIADFVSDNVSGVLARSDGEMARAIVALARDPLRVARLAASDAGLARYEWSALAADHLRLYRGCLHAAEARQFA